MNYKLDFFIKEDKCFEKPIDVNSSSDSHGNSKELKSVFKVANTSLLYK